MFLFFIFFINTSYAQKIKSCKPNDLVIYSQFNFVLGDKNDIRYSVLQSIVNKGEKCNTSNDLQFVIKGQIKNAIFYDSYNNKKEVHTELIKNGTETRFWVDKYPIEISDSYWVMIGLEVYNFSKKIEGGHYIETMVSLKGITNETILKMTFEKGWFGINIFYIPEIVFVVPFPDKTIEERNKKILIWEFEVKEEELEIEKIMLGYKYVHDWTTIIWGICMTFFGFSLKVIYDYFKHSLLTNSHSFLFRMKNKT
jgi:hypothetical protein